MAKTLLNAAKNYLTFIEGTLIPDLRASGYTATAHDFKQLANLLRGRGARRPGGASWSKADFVSFLENTLIPDLKESGREFTAEDFEEGLQHLRNAGMLDGLPRIPGLKGGVAATLMRPPRGRRGGYN